MPRRLRPCFTPPVPGRSVEPKSPLPPPLRLLRWVPFVKREINKVDATQALIDTPEEYARVAASCGGEIRKLTR